MPANADLRISIPFAGPIVAWMIAVAPVWGDEWVVDKQSAMQTNPVLGWTLPSPLDDDETLRISGTLVAQSESDLLLLAPDQRLWRITRSAVLDQVPGAAPMWDASTLERELETTFPDFQHIATEHYFILYDVDRDRAQQSARLLEQVHRGFFEHCRELGIETTPPEHPLVVLLVGEADRFFTVLHQTMGSGNGGIVAVYDMASNLVLVHADEKAHPALQTYVVAPHVPLDARTNLATHLVHEATHQLMCNSGVQQRMAEYPRWLSEGLAAYFEPADPYARNGWRKPGGRNSIWLAQLQQRVRFIPEPDLMQLITNDEQFRQVASAADAYALAWGTIHFLMKRHREAFASYLQLQAALRPLDSTDATQRAEEFGSVFGEANQLQRNWLAFLQQF